MLVDFVILIVMLLKVVTPCKPGLLMIADVCVASITGCHAKLQVPDLSATLYDASSDTWPEAT